MFQAKVEISENFRKEYVNNKKISDDIESYIKSLRSKNRIVVRLSGTEPVIRVCVEGKKMKVLKKESRLKYYEALDKAHTTGNYTDFVKLVTKLEIEMLKKYLELL